jgi:dihydrofolate reductase
MRRIVVNTFVSLDGIMQAPGGPQEDTSGDFKYGGWTVNYWDEVMTKVMGDASQTPYDLLLGRKTYEIFAAHWPYQEDDAIADKFNKATKYVATKTLTAPTWQNTVLLNRDFLEQIKKIKGEDGIELQVHGSGNLLQTLFNHRLVDEMRVWIFPAVLGKGKRLFEEGAVPSNLKLVDSKVSSSGVIITTYVPNGEISTGSFAMENPTSLELKRREKVEHEN